MLQKNRVLPYGYKIADGVAIHNTDEALVVKEVYKVYLEGFSYKNIAKQLTEKEVYFIPTRCDWNANRVKRMLENKSYLGTGFLPPIISEEIFNSVSLLIKSKTANYSETPKEFIAIKGKIICDECGSKIKRYKTGKTSGFVCKNKDCKVSMNYETLEQECSRILSQIKSEESLILDTSQKTSIDEITYITQAFEDELKKEVLDEERAKDLIFARAIAKYRDVDCGESSNTERYIREKIEQDSTSSILSLMEVSKNLTISKEKTVKAILLTNKII